jgi:hypothetical protein
MKDDERDDILSRLDQGFADFRKTYDERNRVIDHRLDAHAHDIKGLREWRNYLSGAWAVIAAGLGLHIKSHGS